jgi:uncharacterized protein YjbJ (UPF0337 family)
MNKDQIKGAANEAKGSIKEAAGKAVGNDKLKAQGMADRAAGKMQKGLGNVKSAARDALR